MIPHRATRGQLNRRFLTDGVASLANLGGDGERAMDEKPLSARTPRFWMTVIAIIIGLIFLYYYQPFEAYVVEGITHIKSDNLIFWFASLVGVLGYAIAHWQTFRRKIFHGSGDLNAEDLIFDSLQISILVAVIFCAGATLQAIVMLSENLIGQGDAGGRGFGSHLLTIILLVILAVAFYLLHHVVRAFPLGLAPQTPALDAVIPAGGRRSSPLAEASQFESRCAFATVKANFNCHTGSPMKQALFARLLLASALTLVISTATHAADRPNILLIAVDDMGYSDIGPFGAEIDTPSIDSLAAEGVRFTNFYVGPSCSPTRSMLFSGNDNHIAGLGNMNELLAPNQIGQPGYEGHLNDRVVSLATIFGTAGYHTYMAGKWHLGHEPEQGPYKRGFERVFTML